MFFLKLASLLFTVITGGVVLKTIGSIFVNLGVFGAFLLFFGNFGDALLDIAFRFLRLVPSVGPLIEQIHSYYNELPSVVRDSWNYFRFGSLMGAVISNYMSNIFLAWVFRRFG